jgi:hypothetical protein
MREVVQVLPKDAIKSIDHPLFDKPENALQMTADERVIGLAHNGDFRAYPIKILSAHEIVNDIVGGTPVCVTWSPLSYSGVVYKRLLLEKQLTFGVTGSIYRNVLVMYDHETDTYWNQLTGTAFYGPLSPNVLEPLPTVVTSWGAWLNAYPGTVILSKEKCPYGHYDEDHMADYYGSEKTGISPCTNINEILPQKEVVFGAVAEGKATVYPLPLLQSARVLHDNLNGVPVVALYDTTAKATLLYHAKLDGATLSLYEKDELFYDYLTGSQWSALNGQAVSGPLRGKTLKQITASTAFWFVWSDHFPESTVYTLPILN